jgi:hypothetical protein
MSTPREAFLDMIADAVRFECDPDEGGIFYELKVRQDSLETLLTALAIPFSRPDFDLVEALHLVIEREQS